jgi:phosphoglycolate phosphatase
MMRAITHVLFDLDGTLADTAPDLGRALNSVLIEHGREPLPIAAIRPVVSLGGAAMVQLAFGIDPGAPGFAGLRDRFLAQYGAGVARESALFPEIPFLLERLEQAGYRWGIVTNKSRAFTTPLVDALGVAGRAACVVSGDTTPHAKPHPEPLLHACRLMQCEPARAVYIGDAKRDVEAARGAGTATVVAAYGYIPPGENVAEWGADALIHSPGELLPWLGTRGQSRN